MWKAFSAYSGAVKRSLGYRRYTAGPLCAGVLAIYQWLSGVMPSLPNIPAWELIAAVLAVTALWAFWSRVVALESQISPKIRVTGPFQIIREDDTGQSKTRLFAIGVKNDSLLGSITNCELFVSVTNLNGDPIWEEKLPMDVRPLMAGQWKLQPKKEEKFTLVQLQEKPKMGEFIVNHNSKWIKTLPTNSEYLVTVDVYASESSPVQVTFHLHCPRGRLTLSANGKAVEPATAGKKHSIFSRLQFWKQISQG